MLWSDALHVGTIANFDFYVCLRAKFHKQSFWVLILAAGGPYWVSISQKKWVPIGSLSQSWGVPISFGDSANNVNEQGKWKTEKLPIKSIRLRSVVLQGDIAEDLKQMKI